MNRNMDLRRATICTVNGLPRRRQRVSTFRDSTDDDKRMELQEMLRLRDREQFHKDGDRDFPKRRRVDNRSFLQQRSGGSYRGNVRTDSSDEEYLEEEEEAKIYQQSRMNQLSPASWSLTNNRRGLHSLRSSPVIRAAGDEVLGVPIPRRARSASSKKLNEYRYSGNGGFRENLSHRKMSPIVSGGSSPSSGASMNKKKMKYVESGTRILSCASNSKPSSLIQDEIEIEVAEALFDLMKQSHSDSQTSEREEKVDRDSINTDDDDLKNLKSERAKDENDALKLQNEQSITVNAETNLADSLKEMNRGGTIEKDNFPDDRAQELVTGDGFVDKGKVGSPRESESPSRVKVNACDIQDLTVTNADNAASVVEAKEARIEIDLMTLPSLPPSPERDAVLDIDPKVTTQDVQKKNESTPKDGSRVPEEKVGVISHNQLLYLNLEKHRDDISSVGESTSPQSSGRKEPNNHSPTSLLSLPISMSSWPEVPSHPGYMQSQPAVLSIDGSPRSSIMQLPQFKLSQPRRTRCATHQYIASNIHNHQQLIEKSLSSGPTGTATLYGTKPLNFKLMLPTQRFIAGNPLLGDFEGGWNSTISPGGSGKDRSSNVAADFNVMISKSGLQQASKQTSTCDFLNAGFSFPQTTTMVPPNSSGPPHPSASAINNNASLPSSNNSSRELSSNSSFPEASASTAMTFNHSISPSGKPAASYMAILHNSGYPFPIPTNISLSSFKGGSSSMPFLNSSFCSPQAQNQHMLSLPSQKSQPSTSTKTSDNNNNSNSSAYAYSFPAQPVKNFGSVGNNNNSNPQPFPLSFGSNASSPLSFSSLAQNPSVLQMLPKMPWNGDKNLPPCGEKSQTRGGQSLSSSAMAPSKFESQSIGFLPSIPNFYHHQQLKSSTIQRDYSSSLPKWDNFPRATTAPEGSLSQSLVNIHRMKNSQAQNHVTISK